MAEKDPIVNLIEEFLEDIRDNEEDKLFEKNIFGKPFPEKLSKKDIKEGKIYNEFSLQHELGEFLKMKFKNDLNYSEFKDFKVQYERNVKDFGADEKADKKKFIKKEMDIAIFKNFEKKSEKYAIELKFPTNRTPDTRMPHFLEDIQFMETVKELGFKTYCLTLVPNNRNGDAFRIPKEPKEKKDSSKETKQKDFFEFFTEKPGCGPKPIKDYLIVKKNKKGVITGEYKIAGNYQIEWKQKTNYCFYYLLPIPDSVKG